MDEKTKIQDLCREDEIISAETPEIINNFPVNFDNDENVQENETTAKEIQQDNTEKKGSEARDDADDAGIEADVDASEIEDVKDETADVREDIKKIYDSLDKLIVQVTMMNRSISAHETIESNLNRELQKYKNDLYTSIATPFILHLISVHSEMEKEIDDINAEIEENKQNGADVDLEEVVDSLRYYYEKISGSLMNSSVEVKKPKVGDKFDPIEHRIAKTVETDDKEKNGIIEAVRSSTYIYNGKILMPAKVVVYKIK